MQAELALDKDLEHISRYLDEVSMEMNSLLSMDLFSDYDVSIESPIKKDPFEWERSKYLLGQKVLDSAGTLVKGGAKAVKNTAKAIKDHGPEVAQTVYNATSKILEKAALVIGKLTKYFKGFVASGLPIINKRLKQIEELKQKVHNAEQTEKDEITFKGIKSFFFVNNDLLDKKEILSKLDDVAEISGTVLGPEKLKHFKEFSEAILEPYSDSIKKSRTDVVVFTLGILAALTNPGVVVGKMLAKLASVASPTASKTIDIGSSLIGAGLSARFVKSISVVIPTVGSQGSLMLRDWSNGRMKTDFLPQYRKLYSFCNNELEGKPDSLYVRHSSVLLFGNMRWIVTDFKPELKGEMKGSIGSLGAKFSKLKVKHEGADDYNLPPLSKDEIGKVITLLTEVLTKAKEHCTNTPEHVNIYEEQYKRISSLVSKYEGDSLKADYIRNSYKNAMNNILGGLWTNSFGSDIKFIHYLIKLSTCFLTYCNLSLNVIEEDNEHREEGA